MGAGAATGADGDAVVRHPASGHRARFALARLPAAASVLHS